MTDKYLILVVDNFLDELYCVNYFSKLYLKFKYHYIQVKDTNIHKKNLCAHEVHYELLVMPFEMMNSLATFQSTMNQIFKLYLQKYVLYLFVNIMVYSKGWEQHLEH